MCWSETRLALTVYPRVVLDDFPYPVDPGAIIEHEGRPLRVRRCYGTAIPYLFCVVGEDERHWIAQIGHSCPSEGAQGVLRLQELTGEGLAAWLEKRPAIEDLDPDWTMGLMGAPIVYRPDDDGYGDYDANVAALAAKLLAVTGVWPAHLLFFAGGNLESGPLNGDYMQGFYAARGLTTENRPRWVEHTRPYGFYANGEDEAHAPHPLAGLWGVAIKQDLLAGAEAAYRQAKHARLLDPWQIWRYGRSFHGTQDWMNAAAELQLAAQAWAEFAGSYANWHEYVAVPGPHTHEEEDDALRYEVAAVQYTRQRQNVPEILVTDEAALAVLEALVELGYVTYERREPLAGRTIRRRPAGTRRVDVVVKGDGYRSANLSVLVVVEDIIRDDTVDTLATIPVTSEDELRGVAQRQQRQLEDPATRYERLQEWVQTWPGYAVAWEPEGFFLCPAPEQLLSVTEHQEAFVT
ncbi:MAG: hypothetical protein KKB13_22005 [Chloroflexi bacterium]|nr:hypothetical protein [Chloroflexota bacterium]